MDSIGLLAAWVAVVSFLVTTMVLGAVHLLIPRQQRWWAMTSPKRARERIQRLYAGVEIAERPDPGYVADLVALYGSMLLNLVSAAAVAVVSIEILDLGPSLLASTLPFSIDARLLTRFTGIIMLALSYYFVFRLTFLAIRIRDKTLPRKPGYSQMALDEIAALRGRYGFGSKQAVGTVSGK